MRTVHQRRPPRSVTRCHPARTGRRATSYADSDPGEKLSGRAFEGQNEPGALRPRAGVGTEPQPTRSFRALPLAPVAGLAQAVSPAAQVAKLVDALDSGSSARKGVEVRVLSWAPPCGTRGSCTFGHDTSGTTPPARQLRSDTSCSRVSSACVPTQGSCGISSSSVHRHAGRGSFAVTRVGSRRPCSVFETSRTGARRAVRARLPPARSACDARQDIARRRRSRPSRFPRPDVRVPFGSSPL